MARKKLIPHEERIDPALRAKFAPIEQASGRVGVADYNKLVDERNVMAEILLRIAGQTVQFAPPLHLPKPDRHVLHRWLAEPFGLMPKGEE